MRKIRGYITCFFLFFSVLMIVCGSVTAQNADINLLSDINGQRNPKTDKIMIIITNSAEPMAITIPVAQLVYGYARHDQKAVTNSLQTIAGIGITAVLNTSMKYAIDRQRPYVTYPSLNYYRKEHTPSFPSGHTAFSFCTATSVSIAYPRWYVIGPFYLWAASVGYSRMYLGEHYPTDVLAGAVVGTGSAWLAYKGNQWLQRRKASHHKEE